MQMEHTFVIVDCNFVFKVDVLCGAVDPIRFEHCKTTRHIYKNDGFCRTGCEANKNIVLCNKVCLLGGE
jgi:hypothetical protein